jgi:hypothetical protein
VKRFAKLGPLDRARAIASSCYAFMAAAIASRRNGQASLQLGPYTRLSGNSYADRMTKFEHDRALEALIANRKR